MANQGGLTGEDWYALMDKTGLELEAARRFAAFLDTEGMDPEYPEALNQCYQAWLVQGEAESRDGLGSVDLEELERQFHRVLDEARAQRQRC